MTEAEWLAGVAVASMTDWLFFDALVSDRKLRLYSVAYCRPVVQYLRQFTPRVTRLLDSVEAFADGDLPPTVLTQHRQELIDQWNAPAARENQSESAADDPDS